MKNSTVSIIVPVYMIKEDMLRSSIESIISQSYKELEIILIDDGSPDQCGNICDEYAAADDRIRVIHKKNEGVSCARNKGFEYVTGEYLTFVDADDKLRPNALKTVIRAMNKSGADCAIFGWEEELEEPGKTRIHKNTEHKRQVKAEGIAATIALDDLKCGGGYPWNKVWRTKTLREADGSIIRFDESLYAYEDKYWILQALKRIQKVLLLPNILYDYRFNPTGLTKKGDFWEYRILNTFDAYKKIVDELDGYPKAQRQAKRFITNFTMDKLYSAWRWRYANLGYYQRLRQKFYEQRDNIRLEYTSGVRNFTKYILLKTVFWWF